MRLTKQSTYAVRIVTDCALAGGELLRIEDIARRYRITKHNIAKTVPVLVRHSIIEAVRGRNGGIRLARPAEDISVGEIVRASESTRVEAECFGGEPVDCAIRPASLINRVLDTALEAFISELDRHTIADMVSDRLKRSVLCGESDAKGVQDGDDPKAEPLAGVPASR